MADLGRLAEAQRILAAWLARYAARSPRTAATYRERLRAIWPDLIARYVRQGQITATDAAELIADWQARWSPASVNLTLSAVRAWWRDMQAAGLLPPGDPWGRLPRLPPAASPVADRVLTREEALRLIRACRPGPERVLAAFLLGTACRVSEAVAATWEQFRSDRGLIYWHFVGKGHKPRTVAIQPELWQWLAPLPPPHTGPLWPGRSRWWAYRVIHAAGQRAGLADRIVSPHVLRHTHATLAVEAGVPLLEVAEQLGHARLDTTRIYVNLRPGPRSGRAVRLPQDLRPDAPG